MALYDYLRHAVLARFRHFLFRAAVYAMIFRRFGLRHIRRRFHAATLLLFSTSFCALRTCALLPCLLPHNTMPLMMPPPYATLR